MYYSLTLIFVAINNHFYNSRRKNFIHMTTSNHFLTLVISAVPLTACLATLHAVTFFFAELNVAALQSNCRKSLVFRVNELQPDSDLVT